MRFCQAAERMLPFFADYFNITYPLNKLDMIAIADFGSGKAV
jgi:aminopeptidase N